MSSLSLETSESDDILHRKTTMNGEARVPDGTETAKKKFIIRLLTEFHKSGTFTFRIEKIIKRVSTEIKINTQCTILPGRVIISFPEDQNESPSKKPSYTFSTAADDLVVATFIDLVKIDHLERLYYDLVSKRVDLYDANDRLRRIENAASVYNDHVKLLSRFFISASCAIMFYGGSWIDGAVGGILGMLTALTDEFSEKIPGITYVLPFINSLVVGLVGTLVDRWVFNGGNNIAGLCTKAYLLGGSVFQFPGLMITFAFLELYSGQTMYGATKLIHGICQASQIGFGLAMGYLLVAEEADTPLSFEYGCSDSVDKVWDVIFIPLYTISLGIPLNSSMEQFIGSVISSIVAYVVYNGLDLMRLPIEIVPLFTAIALTTTSRLYAWFNGNEKPIVYTMMGLMMLTPGTMGVTGSFNTSMGESVTDGLAFTMRMIIAGVSISVGVFITLIPNLSWCWHHMRSERSSSNLNNENSHSLLQDDIEMSNRDRMRKETTL